MRHAPCGYIAPRIPDAESTVPALGGQRPPSLQRKDAIPQTRYARQLPLHKGAFRCAFLSKAPSDEAASLPFTQGRLSVRTVQGLPCVREAVSEADGRVVFAPTARNLIRAVRHTYYIIHYSLIDTACNGGLRAARPTDDFRYCLQRRAGGSPPYRRFSLLPATAGWGQPALRTSIELSTP